METQQVKHIHIKIPKSQYDLLKKIKADVGVDMQTFIVSAIEDKLKLIRK